MEILFKLFQSSILTCFSSTYCCESTVSALQNIKNNKRNQLVDDSIICAVSCCEPRYLEIVKSTETRISN